VGLRAAGLGENRKAGIGAYSTLACRASSCAPCPPLEPVRWRATALGDGDPGKSDARGCPPYVVGTGPSRVSEDRNEEAHDGGHNRRGGRLIRRLFWASATLFSASPALAETPFVADEWKFGRRQESSTLHYCLDARDPDLPIARKIGEAVAGALLLQPKEHVIGENVVGESIDSLYRVFLESCDVYFGFKAASRCLSGMDQGHASLLPTAASYVSGDRPMRPGARSPTVPTSHAIGSTMGTSGRYAPGPASAGPHSGRALEPLSDVDG